MLTEPGDKSKIEDKGYCFAKIYCQETCGALSSIIHHCHVNGICCLLR